MPYQQLWVDPNTGATFPQSYVRVLDTKVQPNQNNQAGLAAARWASVTCFSLGKQPIDTHDLLVTGAAYQANYATPVAGAVASYNGMLASTSDAYIGTLPTMSGATPVP